MKIAYEHIVNHIKESPTIGELSDKLFQLGHEHEIEGNIFDMEFTPNRGDCLSLNGLLRDLAVFYTIDNYQKIFTEKINDLSIDFENKSENICSRISFLKLEVANNPIDYKPFLNSYFSNLHLNKNNFFTDVSNYLSYETGQPTHCYDANKMKGKLIFHEINEHKEFETLLNKKLLLSNKNAVFSLDGKVINLAGIVGGKSTSCSSDTKSVIIECAYFHPESIIGKSVKYDIQSESAHKFERGTDPDCHEKVLRRFIEIVRQHVKIKQMSLVSFNYKENFMHEIPFDLNKINRVIGSNINEEECLGYLSKLGFFFEKSVVKVPSYRNDIKNLNDIKISSYPKTLC